VTLADVAAAAGVSVATASVAITGRRSGNCRVSVSVAERIRETARQLNYRPNLQARNLSTQRTRTIAVLIKRAAWHNAMFYVAACQRLLRERGYVESCMLYPDNTLESEREHLNLCIERQVEGIITMPLIDLEGRANVELLNRVRADEGIPLVQLGLAVEGCKAPSVVTDEAGGIAKAVTLLHAMGHRRIAHATIFGYDNPNPLNPFRIARLRYEGYLKGITELGLEPMVFAPTERCTDTEMLYDSSALLTSMLLSAAPRPTAVVAFSDFTGAGLISGLSHAGLSLPDDMSIMATGDQPFCKMLRPALTTLAPPYERQGELATQELLKMIETGAPGESHSLLPSLINRESIAKLRAS
jgi:DNA-binding LacI/PurR family transcriptional regulator